MTKLFASVLGTTLTAKSFLICLLAAAAFGFVIALVHMYKTKCSQSFAITLALLPMMIAVIILLVNGSVGTGIAVAGAFSLTRFRSQPGTGKEISSIFFAMVTGLACGTGYVGIALLFTAIVGVLSIVYQTVGFGKKASPAKELMVVIPENLDFEEVFDSIFKTYTESAELTKIRTTNMGSMYKLKYEVVLKNDADKKKFMDEIRVRNGNLEVMLGKIEEPTDVM